MKLFLIAFLISTYSFSQDTLAVQSIPDAITEAKKGNYVSLGLLSDTETTFPADFFDIPKENLIALVIDDCRYTSFPEKLNEYTNLVYFRYSWFMFDDCPITTFPSFLVSAAALEHLQIEGMPLSSIPSLSKLIKLESLFFTKCELAEFPGSVLHVTSLTELDLSCNNFNSIPEGISNLVNLRSLNFYGGVCGTTPIANVPKSLSKLTKLEFLRYGNTEIDAYGFPDYFKTLPISK